VTWLTSSQQPAGPEAPPSQTLLVEESMLAVFLEEMLLEVWHLMQSMSSQQPAESWTPLLVTMLVLLVGRSMFVMFLEKMVLTKVFLEGMMLLYEIALLETTLVLLVERFFPVLFLEGMVLLEV
jgi:hypothetical protein